MPSFLKIAEGPLFSFYCAIKRKAWTPFGTIVEGVVVRCACVLDPSDNTLSAFCLVGRVWSVVMLALWLLRKRDMFVPDGAMVL